MNMKYPILLVHGIVLKESKFFHAFGKIGKRLQAKGYCVFIGKHDGFGTVENNAKQLQTQIEDVLAREKADKINIIAHSKGGLDCKYLISALGMEDKIASLTTLCTPHFGSPVASRIMKYPKCILKTVAFWVNFWYRIFGDKHPDAYNVCKELQLHNDVDPYPFSDKVYCQSYSSTMKSAKDDFVMGIPLVFSRRIQNGATDGLVPIDSSVFELYRGNCLSDSVSHSQIVDFMVPKKKKELIYSFYCAICKELADMGF